MSLLRVSFFPLTFLLKEECRTSVFFFIHEEWYKNEGWNVHVNTK
jgi:hypothetical protein